MIFKQCQTFYVYVCGDAACPLHFSYCMAGRPQKMNAASVSSIHVSPGMTLSAQPVVTVVFYYRWIRTRRRRFTHRP